MTSPYKIKRLFLDIETSLSVVGSFTLWPKNISHETIFQEWYIICVAYKWQGDKDVQVICSNGQNDKSIVKKIYKLMSKADEIVYHNGAKFDYKKIQTRALFHGLDPIMKPKETDTLRQAKKHFSFSSNKLDYIAKYLDVGRKINTSMSLWIRVLKGEKLAVKEMADYCAQDVLVLEDVYNKLRPYMDVGYNYNVSHGLGDRCPVCGSDDIRKHGFRYTSTNKYQAYICNKCKKAFQSGKSMEYKGIGRPMR